MARIRIKSPTMKKFSSYMGTVKFENGVSVDHVSEAEARMLGSITAIEFIDDKDEHTGNAGMGQANIDLRSVKAPDVSMPKPLADKPEAPEQIATPNVDGPIEKKIKDDVEDVASELENELEEIETPEAEAEMVTYSREQLEAIADEQGIAGLREIGDALGQRSNSVEGLVSKILANQKG